MDDEDLPVSNAEPIPMTHSTPPGCLLYSLRVRRGQIQIYEDGNKYDVTTASGTDTQYDTES